MDFAGLDAHKESVQACLKGDAGQLLKEQRFGTTDTGLEKLYQTVKNARCVIEASTACYPVYDYLHDRGVQIRVAHPKRVKAICSAKLKTDKVDARMLADLERANLIPEAHIPSKEVRDKRDLVRHHISLTKQRTRLINQTKASLLRYRVRLPKNIFTKTAQRLAVLSRNEFLSVNCVGLFRYMKKLNLRQIRWIIREMKRGEQSVYRIARTQRVSPRWVRKLFERFKSTALYKIRLKEPGRKPEPFTDSEVFNVSLAKSKFGLGAVNLETILTERGAHISHNRIHQILKKNGLAKTEPKKSKRRTE